MNAKELKALTATAKGFVNDVHGFNTAPLAHFEKALFSNGNTTRNTFNYYYRHVREFADAKTFFISMFFNFDIFVWCESLYYNMAQAFPEISKATINGWINEYKQPHHVIRNYEA